MKEKLAIFFEKCVEKSQEERKKLQLTAAIISGVILLASVFVSMQFAEGIMSFFFCVVLLIMVLLANYFERHTGWNTRYYKLITLGIASALFVLMALYGFISGEAFMN